MCLARGHERREINQAPHPGRNEAKTAIPGRRCASPGATRSGPAGAVFRPLPETRKRMKTAYALGFRPSLRDLERLGDPAFPALKALNAFDKLSSRFGEG